MKPKHAAPLTRLSLHRETLRDLNRLREVAGGLVRPTAPGQSCFPVVCFTTTVASGTC